MSTPHLPASYTFRAPSGLVAGHFLCTAVPMLLGRLIHVHYTTVSVGSTEVITDAIVTHATAELLQKIARSMPGCEMIAHTLEAKPKPGEVQS